MGLNWKLTRYRYCFCRRSSVLHNSSNLLQLSSHCEQKIHFPIQLKANLGRYVNNNNYNGQSMSSSTAGVLTDHVWSLLTIPIAFLINTNLEDDRIKSARVVIKTVLLLINRG